MEEVTFDAAEDKQTKRLREGHYGTHAERTLLKEMGLAVLTASCEGSCQNIDLLDCCGRLKQ